MHTITLLVTDVNEESGRVGVQIIPNDGISLEVQLSALRIAENITITQLVQAAEQRGRDGETSRDTSPPA